MAEVRTLLPVKQSDGRWIYPTETVPEENESQASDSEEERTPKLKKERKAPQALIQKYANEHGKLSNIKSKIAVLCSMVTGDPENNMRALKELLLMLQKPTTKLIVTETKLLCLSLMHVFTDVLPSYKIRQNQEVDKKQKLKKQTKSLLNFETSLLRYYKKYIDALQVMVNKMKPKLNKKAGVLTPAKRKAFQKIGVTATRCLCDLLVNRYYFNYHKTVINIVVPLACSKNEVVSTLCCKALGTLYKSDKLGEASLDAVRQTVKIVKERQFHVPVPLLRTFLCLKLQEANPNEKKPKADMKRIRKQMGMMSRKEKRYKKKMQELQTQLRETEAQENVESKSKLQTEILKKIFWIYFHVLKDDDKMLLITPVLEGLSKFAHLINLEFFDDLSMVLYGLMENGTLSDTDKLHCMQTVFVILSGQAQSLNIDPQGLYSHLYNLLLNLDNSTNIEQFQATLHCLELMLIKRKRKITLNRFLAFIKRLATTMLQTPLYFALATSCLLRMMLLSTKSADILLDTETTLGTGVFLPELEDPEYCNPRSTSLWELHLLLKHYNPVVSTYVRHLLHSCPIQGRLQLPEKLLKLQPDQILKHYSEVSLENKDEFEEYKRPLKRLCIRPTLECLMDEESNSHVSWMEVENVDFTCEGNES